MNALLRRIVTVSLAVLVVALPAFAADERIPTTIEADRIGYDGAAKRSTAEGGVRIVREGKIITGDRAVYDRVSGDGVIEGNVRYITPTSDLTARRFVFNAFTGLGTLYSVRGKFEGGNYIVGEVAVKDAVDHYVIEEGLFTTCDCIEKVPTWALAAAHVDLTVEEYVYLTDATVQIHGTSVFYLPWFMAPVKTKRATGFLRPSFSLSDRHGFQMDNSFFWAVADNADATLTHHYLGDAGNQIDLEGRYILSGATHGRLNVEYLAETDPEKETTANLWQAKYDHRQWLPAGFDGIAHIDTVSDQRLLSEYGASLSDRSRRYTDSYVIIRNSWGSDSFSLTTRQLKSLGGDVDETYRYMPEVVYTHPSQPIVESPVYGTLETSYLSQSQRTEQGGVETDNYGVDRFDFAPTLSLPVSVAPWLSATPWVSGRSTWYSGAPDADGSSDGQSYNREFYSAGLVLKGPQLFRIFDREDATMPRIKHLITPVVSYSYTPGYEFDGEDRRKNRVFDAVDAAGVPANSVTYSLTNHLVGKETLPGAEATTRTLAWFAVSQSYNLNEAARTDNPDVEKRPFSSIALDLDTHIRPNLMFRYRTTYDPYEGFWDSSALEFGYRFNDALHLAWDRVYQWGRGGADQTWDTAYVEINTPWKVSVDYSVVYNEVEGETNDSALRFLYKEDCWGLSLNYVKRKLAVTDEAGLTTMEDETRFTFAITLNGVGDVFGSPERAVAGRKL
jgi:LPS-assembly protein